MHGNVRLCVERCRHSWSCPVKRLRSSGAERARAAISGGAKRSRAPMSSAPAEPRWQVQCLRAARSSNFEHLGGAERVRAAILSAPVEPSGLERPFRAPSEAERARAAILSAPIEPSGFDVTNVGRCGVFEATPNRIESARAAILNATVKRGSQERGSKRERGLTKPCAPKAGSKSQG